MATFKNVSGTRIDIPLYGLHIGPDDTFEVPDDVAFSFDTQPEFTRSRTQSPTTVITPETVTAQAGPIPATPPDPTAAPTPPPASDTGTPAAHE